MLILLMPEQIADHWERIKKRVMDNLPPSSPDGSIDANRILEAILVGRLQLWFSVGKEQLSGFCITEVLGDPFTSTKTLLIYVLFTFDERKTSLEEWTDGFATLAAFGRLKGCSRISAYSNNEKVLRIVDYLKGDASYRYITWEV